MSFLNFLFPARISRLPFALRFTATLVFLVALIPRSDLELISAGNMPYSSSSLIVILALSLYQGFYVVWPRLVDTKLPRYLIVLILVPTANLIFFVLLAILPSKPPPPPEPPATPPRDP